MNITVEKHPKCLATIRVEIPADQVNKERSTIIKSFATQANIKGFRPGKAPKAVITKQYGKAITEELEGRLIRSAYSKAVEQESLAIIEAKAPTDITHQDDGTLTFNSTFILSPEFTLPEYKGIPIEVDTASIDSAQIDDELEQLRERFAEFLDIEDRPTAQDDIAIIDYTTTIDGQPLEDVIEKSSPQLNGQQGYALRIAEESFLPGFAAQLIGLNIDEEKTILITIPADYPVEEIREKSLTFQVKLTGLKQQVLPEIDDAFVEKIVPGKTIDQLRSLIENELQTRKQKQTEDAKVDQLINNLTTQTSLELPEEILQSETQGQADTLVQRGVNSGLSDEQLGEQQDEIFAAASNQAQLNLRTTFILQKIANDENIEVSKDELLKNVNSMAQSANKSPKKHLQELQKNGQLGNLRHNLLMTKTIDFLLEHAIVTEKPLTESTQP